MSDQSSGRSGGLILYHLIPIKTVTNSTNRYITKLTRKKTTKKPERKPKRDKETEKFSALSALCVFVVKKFTLLDVEEY